MTDATNIIGQTLKDRFKVVFMIVMALVVVFVVAAAGCAILKYNSTMKQIGELSEINKNITVINNSNRKIEENKEKSNLEVNKGIETTVSIIKESNDHMKNIEKIKNDALLEAEKESIEENKNIQPDNNDYSQVKTIVHPVKPVKISKVSIKVLQYHKTVTDAEIDALEDI